MRRIGIMAFVFLTLIGVNAMGQQRPQLTPVPPKPTCTIILRNGACADLWRAYNAAVAQRTREELQLYVDRQKELASSAATAPLQEQISSLTKLNADQQSRIAELQKQMESDAAAALEARQADATAAHQEGLVRGLEMGIGGSFVLIVLIFGITRLRK
jgi:hypothetical protein